MNPLLIIGLLALVAILAIAYVNRERCVQEGDPCGSSSKGCCANLVCSDDVCSKPIEDTYEKYQQSRCELMNSSNPILKDETQSLEDFAKVVMNRCDQCRKDPTSDPWCYNLPCEGFLIDYSGDFTLGNMCAFTDKYPIVTQPDFDVYKYITDES